ncbi:MAG: DNA internalization-related competence protein ComEC/Rec2 [Lachnospiraceae bacterium]|nr:DNA internalization-related competence protein ComEC/Rec2 [Lachnospiraceae bacterium]
MKRPLFAVCLCLVIAMAIWRGYQSYDHNREGSDSMYQMMKAQDNSFLTVTGRVYQKDNQNFYLDSVYYQIEAVGLQQTFSLSENLICEYPKGVELKLGCIVKLRGRFDVFEKATNQGEFDFQGYYQTKGIIGKLSDIFILERTEEYSVWQETLYDLRSYFRERLYQIFPQKEASIMAAMLLGDKSDLDKEVKALYQENGIIHILSISGLHITIIGMGIYQLLRRMGAPTIVAALCGSVILGLYGAMTGFGISACRAIGMYLLRMLGEVVGRTYDMLTAMGIMATILVWDNPMLLQNAGFLLSFGSIAGIGLLYPALLPKLKQSQKKYEERVWVTRIEMLGNAFEESVTQSMLTGVSVTLMTLPIQLWFYYEIPTYSILINLFVLPFMSMVMISGMLGMLIPGLGIVGTLSCVILSMYELLCEAFVRLPYSTWNPGRPDVWQIILYYACLLVIILRRKWHGKIRQGFLAGVAVASLGIHVQEGTTITFLDVGQGDCICVQTVEGVYLFDCGSSSRSKVGEYVLKPFLKYHGIQKIDAAFLSHPDADHCNGIMELLKAREEWGIDVERLFLPDVDRNIYNEQLIEWEVTAREVGGVRVDALKVGDIMKGEELTLLCLHPPQDYEVEEANVYSLCFYIQMEEGKTLLLTGDVEKEGEERLLKELKTRRIQEISLLKVAHHGSKYSTQTELLEQLKPEYAVISCGHNNRYGHPHEETLERLEAAGSEVHCTMEGGQITVQITKEGMQIKEYIK